MKRRLPSHLGLGLLLAGGALSSCDDTLYGAPPESAVSGTDFCAVQQVFDQSCVGCHGGASPVSGLDLATDPHGALVGVDSPTYPGNILVEAGNPDASLLLAKMAGSNPAGTGGVMPTSGALDAEVVEAVRTWIREGAAATCADGGDGADGDSGAGEAEGWCRVDHLIRSECLACHSAASALGGLDLETDAYTAIVGVASTVDASSLLVAPGDRAVSLFWRKLAGTQAGNQGGPMPPGSPLAAGAVEAVGLWIDSGATSECADPIEDSGTTGTHHPAGWADPAVHGLGAKHQEERCIECHGADLNGGLVGVSCDSCHDPGWRTNCTFCHGGTDNATGAPPRDIDGDSTQSNLSFRAHTAHVSSTISHTAFDCVQCHLKPTDVLSAGHVFVGDATPGLAELRFSGGLSDAGLYGGAGSCSNLYCHGYNGQDNGSYDHSQPTPSCTGCHPNSTSGRDAWEGRMSGEHEEHLREGARCSDCHGATVNGGGAITTPALHVNGSADIAMPSGMTRYGSTCTGTCHIGDRTENHSSAPW